jgi:hypothetical protein
MIHMIAMARSARLAHAVRLSPVGTLACVALAAVGAVWAAGAAPATIATLHGLTEVRAWNGVQAWTDYSAADKHWHVVVRSAGTVSIPAAIPAAGERLGSSSRALVGFEDVPPDAIGSASPQVDVGPGPGGRPTLAFVSCAGVCRVVVSGLDGSRAQTVTGSAGASSPTIWRSRVAWVRGKKTVLTRRLSGGKVRRLAGVPRRKCYEPMGRRRCERPADASVNDLELHGSRLALIVTYGLSQGGGNGQSEVRMESVRGGRPHLVALTNVGEDAQAWIGPSWANGDLFFYKSCLAGGACAGGPYRYDPAGSSYAKAGLTPPLAGFAMDDNGRRAFQAGLVESAPRSATWPLRLIGPLTFRRTRPPIARPGA